MMPASYIDSYSESAFLEELIGENGYRKLLSSEIIAKGTQSEIYLLKIHDINGDTQNIVAKIFKDSYPQNNIALINREYDALLCFFDAIEKCGDLNLKTPKPLRLIAKQKTILMSYEAGQPLSKFIPKETNTLKIIAAQIIKGLNLYHIARNDIYGDFHLGNILFQLPERITFLDPTPPVDWIVLGLFNPLKYKFLAVDIGYLIYCSCVIMPKVLLVDPLYVYRGMRLLSHICAEVCLSCEKNSRSMVWNEISIVVMTHISRLSRSSIRGYLIGIAGRLFFAALKINKKLSIR